MAGRQLLLVLLELRHFRGLKRFGKNKKKKKKKGNGRMSNDSFFLLLVFWRICFVCACPVVIKSKPGRQTILGTI